MLVTNFGKDAHLQSIILHSGSPGSAKSLECPYRHPPEETLGTLYIKTTRAAKSEIKLFCKESELRSEKCFGLQLLINYNKLLCFSRRESDKMQLKYIN